MKEHIKFGVYGAWRGLAHIRAIHCLDNASVTALLEQDPVRREEGLKYCASNVTVCQDYDELLDCDIDAVILCNYLPDHAASAIKALKKGIHVISECLAAATMQECVELVETVEETGCYYTMAENTPYLRSCTEMERLYKSGVLGDVIFAEGEYAHPSNPAVATSSTTSPDHWRKRLPRTYYLTHSLGPLMKMTNLMPRKVIGKVSAGPSYAKRRGSQNADCAGIMLVEMDGGVLFQVTGCTSYGPETHWFRLACANGGVENIRFDENRVSLCLNPWDIPENNHSFGSKTVYEPLMDEVSQFAQKKDFPLRSGHSEADFRTVWTYVHDLLCDREPFMDVYRSVSMSAVAILGWRSVLNEGKQYLIPDFKKAEDRDLYRNDELSPWKGTVPFCVNQIV